MRKRKEGEVKNEKKKKMKEKKNQKNHGKTTHS